ncbi:MAG TPA: FmdB family zinc ribbon protein [Ktedonobacteraceae bacterium]|nr:FmdB family zinc ribbon protein [Ktedonobacteraceae bacterium]
MPTYEYVCRSCEHRFEQWQKMTDDPLQICPECGGHVRRVLYPAGIVFKGSGFYSTDHSASGSVGSNNGHDHKHEEDQKHEEKAAAAATTNANSDGSSSASTANTTGAATDAKKAETAAPATTTK